MLALWHRLASLPGGRRLASWVVGRTAPYTASIHATIESLAPGHARVAMRDRRSLRNPFRSVHAIALANLAEEASGLAVLTAIGEARAILIAFRIGFSKKARGRLVAESRVPPRRVTEPGEIEATATITDASGETVAEAVATWRVAPPEA